MVGERDGVLDGILVVIEKDGYKDGTRLGLLVGVEDGFTEG